MNYERLKLTTLVILVFSLVLLVFGATYAICSNLILGTTDNILEAGLLSFSFNEDAFLGNGINIENDRVILRRYIRDTGKSGAWIDNVPVTRADLAQFSSFLIDIHGQHEHQSLMKVSEHRKFLDARAGIENEVANFTKMYALLVEKRKQLQEYCATEGELERKIEMLQFAVQEISQAQLKKDEDENKKDDENEK